MKKQCIILIFLIISRFCFGQQSLLDIHYHQFDISEGKTSYKTHTSYTNEAKVVASVFFLFYKEYISSQDINSCVFEPSCSVYAMESVKKMGLFKGLLNAFDRVSRCHPMANKYYPFDPQTQRLYDPVEE
jgi:uncharacterized protein